MKLAETALKVVVEVEEEKEEATTAASRNLNLAKILPRLQP